MKIAFCGDLMLTSPEIHRIGDELLNKLEDCQVQCINFEVPVKTIGTNGIHKSGPVLAQSPQTVNWIKNYGFNLITLANNHACDYGIEGLRNTLSCFNGMALTGIGTQQTAYNITIIEKEGSKIGFLGLTHKEFGCVDVDSGEKIGTAMLTSPKVFKTIVNAKKEVDRLYILPHAGV